MTRSLARRARLRRTAAAALLPLSLAVLAGCGEGDDGTATEPAAAPSSAAEDASPTADPAPAEGETVDPVAFTESLLAGFEEGGTATVEMTTEALGMKIAAEGVADYAADPPATAMVLEDFLGSGQTLEVRLVDGTMYLNMGRMTGGKFAVVDPSDPGNPLGKEFTEQMDPRASLESFQEAVGGVVYVGEEDLDGEAARHYRLEVDSAKLLDGLGPQAGGAQGALPEKIGYDVWLGAEDGLFRRMELDMGELGSTVMTMSDWGEPVEIEAPPTSEQTTMPEMPGAPAA